MTGRTSNDGGFSALQSSLTSLTMDQVSAEYDQLRSLRRRSLSNANDPDLPNSVRSPPVPPSPTLSSPPASPSEVVDLPFSHAFAKGPSTLPSTPVSAPSSDADTPLPSNDLMWLPAHLHPDVAPQEFRAFLAEQTKPEALLRRSGSLSRRKSMLSNQYTPTTNDEPAAEIEPTIPTDTSSRRRDPLENLTITDLQKLEQLAVQAAQEGDKGDEGKEHFKKLLMRSMSTGPSVGECSAPLQCGQCSTKEAENADVDSQPLVPASGGLIRRTARTKIRKATLEGDGGGHRFGPSRRAQRRESDQSSVDHASTVEHVIADRRSSFTDSDELHDETSPVTPTSSSSEQSPTMMWSPVRERSVADPSWHVPPLLAPIPKSPSSSDFEDERPSAPAPFETRQTSPTVLAPPVAPAISIAPPPSIGPVASTSKRSGWARLVSRGTSPKSSLDEEDESSDAASVASSSSKKSQKSVFSNLFRTRNRDDASREADMPSQLMISPTASGMLNKNGRYTNFYRLPIHVERAVYRLSHIKLANPRRPLLEQVLISNLMFWYLGVIHRPGDTNGAQVAPPGIAPEPVLRLDSTMRQSSTLQSESPPPLAKRPAPVPREPQIETSFEALYRQSASHPSATSQRGADEWMNSWPKGRHSPTRENGMLDGS